MRPTTLHTTQRAFEGIEARQSRQVELQQQLGTGLRVSRPGDDPVAAAQAEMARSRLTRLAQDQRATQLATTVLTTADGALSQGVNLLQSAREALVAAGNGAYSPNERQALAQTLRNAREQMLALANTDDGAGNPVFGGQGTSSDPLDGATVTWSAPSGVQRIGEAGRYAASVDGRAAFMTLPQGNGVFVTAAAATNTGAGWIEPGTVADATQLTGHNLRIDIGGAPGALTYSVQDLDAGTTLASAQPLPADGSLTLQGQRLRIAGAPAAGDQFSVGPAGRQNVFQTLDDAIATLEQPLSNAAYAQRLGRAQADLDRALDGMTLMRGQIGQELNKVDTAIADGEGQALAVTARRSALRDLDYAAAISELQSNQTGLEAALRSYTSVGKTSLFQLLP